MVWSYLASTRGFVTELKGHWPQRMYISCVQGMGNSIMIEGGKLTRDGEQGSDAGDRDQGSKVRGWYATCKSSQLDSRN